MDPTSGFFSKLRRLAVTLETETTKLQSAFENCHSDEDYCERTARGTRAFHELNCEVLDVKAQLQDDVTQQKTKVDEVSCFIKDCELQQLKLSEDLNVIKTYWEKYGYQAPKSTENTNGAINHSHKEEAATEDEERVPDQVEDRPEEAEEELSPVKPAPPLDPMRTPQLSDFGLSEIQLRRALKGIEWCAEVPQMPEINLPHPALSTPAPPTMAMTPKRALRMDEEELLTPQMHHFGISEHTMLFNNDFTMNLQLKNVEKTKKQQNPLESPVNPVIENLQANDDLESPEPPVFCTPGLKIRKTLPAFDSSSESPTCLTKLPSTPDVPAFQTPFVNRLRSTVKSERKPEPVQTENDCDNQESQVPALPHDGAVVSKRSWECDVPHLKMDEFMTAGDVPQIPNLESNLGNSLQIRSAKMQKKTSDLKMPLVSALDLDGPTQEFNLRTPCVRREYEEPSTPEMPDLNSVTQDICKLVSQAQLKKSASAVKNPQEKENTSPQRFDTLSSISEQEFQGLPVYLRQMNLDSLNQAVDNINSSIAKCKRDKTEFHIEELKRMINFGAMTPLFIVCLSELKRMHQVRGTRSDPVYKLFTQP